MARVAYTDLFLIFTTGASTPHPNQTEIGALIKAYYKQAYEVAYGVGNYNDTDSDTTDPKTIIRSDELFGRFQAEISWKVNMWYQAGIGSGGTIVPAPDYNISPTLETFIKRAVSKKSGRIVNIRMWGHDYDEGDML